MIPELLYKYKKDRLGSGTVEGMLIYSLSLQSVGLSTSIF